MIYKNLTLKEINIIFQHTYNLRRINQYLRGTRMSTQEYDVYEIGGEIMLRRSDSYAGSMIVVSGKEIK